MGDEGEESTLYIFECLRCGTADESLTLDNLTCKSAGHITACIN